MEVMVLPEMSARDTLRAARLAALDPLRSAEHACVLFVCVRRVCVQ